MIGRLLLLAYIIGLVFYGEQLKDDFINLNRKSVVMLTNLTRNSGGTGFYVKGASGKTYIMTNGHVCRLKESGTILSNDGENIDTVEVIAEYENNDLCILTAPERASAISLASSVRNTENIYVMGHPLLEPKTLTKGQLAGGMTIDVLQGIDMPNCKGKTYREVPLEGLLRFFYGGSFACVRTTTAHIITANILPGNSGSPVLNTYGHVVGVVYAGQQGSGRGFIVPLEEVKDFLRDK